ncbi:MAG: hypothetical protein NTV98_05035 [Candidatus Roizmanbacteria bacterium]|nr:hypothetical protein [Candidatus Roizmanbacteria bacterium]
MKNNNRVDVPTVIFALAFFVLIIGLFSKFMFHNNTIILEKKQTPTTTSTSSQKSAKIPKKLNYNLPILCDYKTRESSMSAMVNIDSISVSIASGEATRTYIVQGDCLYVWDRKVQVGKKKCGVGNYIIVRDGKGWYQIASITRTRDIIAKFSPFSKGYWREGISVVILPVKGII